MRAQEWANAVLWSSSSAATHHPPPTTTKCTPVSPLRSACIAGRNVCCRSAGSLLTIETEACGSSQVTELSNLNQNRVQKISW